MPSIRISSPATQPQTSFGR